MKKRMNNKGLAHVLIVLIALAAIGYGFVYYSDPGNELSNSASDGSLGTFGPLGPSGGTQEDETHCGLECKPGWACVNNNGFPQCVRVGDNGCAEGYGVESISCHSRTKLLRSSKPGRGGGDSELIIPLINVPNDQCGERNERGDYTLESCSCTWPQSDHSSDCGKVFDGGYNLPGSSDTCPEIKKELLEGDTINVKYPNGLDPSCQEALNRACRRFCDNFQWPKPTKCCVPPSPTKREVLPTSA